MKSDARAAWPALLNGRVLSTHAMARATVGLMMLKKFSLFAFFLRLKYCAFCGILESWIHE